jgi:hypothetical protein
MTFFLDLWQDLREKRLWPVAVGLLAAAIAIPLIMLKPAADPQTPAPIAVNSGERETLPAVNVDASPVHGSKLETFSTRNPFKPLGDLEDDPSSDGGGSSGGGSGSGSSSDGTPFDPTGGAGSGGGTPSGGGGLPDLPSGGSDGGTPSTPTTPVQPERWYRFAVDVKFGAPDNQKTIREVPRLASLPDAETPAVVFMGVTDGGDRAVFYVADPSLAADGEGECEDESSCRVVTLGLTGGSDEETFTSADGTVQYDLQLLRIRREEMDEPQSQGKVAAPADEPAEKAAAKTIAASEDEFLPLVLASADVAFATE